MFWYITFWDAEFLFLNASYTTLFSRFTRIFVTLTSSNNLILSQNDLLVAVIYDVDIFVFNSCINDSRYKVSLVRKIWFPFYVSDSVKSSADGISIGTISPDKSGSESWIVNLSTLGIANWRFLGCSFGFLSIYRSGEPFSDNWLSLHT